MTAVPVTLILGLCFAWQSLAASAGNLSVSVKNDKGETVEDAVVYVSPPDRSIGTQTGSGDVMIDQKGKEFIPRMSAVHVGTKVHFPNSDNIRHHVYSFSAARTFEIPLYKGTPSNPITFDKPGVVVLGCNIHDWMSAYVFVTESPYFSVTDKEGKTKIGQLPAGSYKVEVWHPHMKGAPKPANHQVSLKNNDKAELAFVIKQKRVWSARRSTSALRGGYR